jgi:hypothetical protein
MLFSNTLLSFLALDAVSYVAAAHFAITGAVTGIDGTTGATPERLNINDVCSRNDEYR